MTEQDVQSKIDQLIEFKAELNAATKFRQELQIIYNNLLQEIKKDLPDERFIVIKRFIESEALQLPLLNRVSNVEESETEKANRRKAEKMMDEREPTEIELKELNDAMSEALEKLDYNKIKEIRGGFMQMREKFNNAQNPQLNESNEAREFIIKINDCYGQLLEEAEKAGITKVVRTHHQTIRKSIHHKQVLEIELNIVETVQLDEIEEITTEKSYHADPETVKSDQESLSNELESTSVKDWSKILKSASGVGKIIVGGLLSATNLTLGISAFLMTGMNSTSGQSIPIFIGIANSFASGLNYAADGVKNISEVIKSPEAQP